MHACIEAVKAKALLLVGYMYASMAHVPFCVAGLVHNLIPFLDQAFIKEVLEVLKSGIYVPFYLLLGLIKLLLELLAMGACTHVKLIVLLLESIQEKLHNFLLFAEVALLQDQLEEAYVHDGKLDVVTSPRELPAGDILAISNSFGFGGHNAVVAFRSYN